MYSLPQRTPEHMEFSGIKRILLPVVCGSALLGLAGCSTEAIAPHNVATDTTSSEIPGTTIMQDGTIECIPTPELSARITKLIDDVSKRTDSRFYDVRGEHTVKDDQTWIVTANWKQGTKFGWLVDPGRADKNISYVLTSNDSVLVNDQPRVSKWGGPYFEPANYKIICDPKEVKYLGDVLATVPE